MFSLFPSRAVAIELFGFSVHWYGLLYLLGFILAYFLLPKLQAARGLKLNREQWANFLTWVVLGVLIGGRLGFVLFYEPLYFLHNPLKIFAVWEGGMASHGGFIGVLTAFFIFCRRYKVSIFTLGDIIVIPAAIGLALGRIGNFINQELYGLPTTLPWGIAIPGAEELRHPTQIYAVIKDLFIALSCYLFLIYKKPAVPGQTGSLFLILYGILRFSVEFLRVQDHPMVNLGFIKLSRAQLLTIPVFFGGVLGWWISVRKKQSVTPPVRSG